MTIKELNEVLRGIPADRLDDIKLEYLDSGTSDQWGEEFFADAREVRLTIEQIGPSEYAYRLRIV